MLLKLKNISTLYSMKGSICIAILLLSLFSAHAGDIVIIVSKKSPIDTISLSELKKFYIGKQTTLNAVFAMPTLQDNSEHKKFLEEYLNMNARQFARTWQKQVFTGKAQMPYKAHSAPDIIKRIQENETYIGYIDKSDLTDAVKTVVVE